MIKPYTYLNVADNSGAKRIRAITILRCGKNQVGHLSSIIVATVKDALPNGAVKRKEVVRAVVVRQRFPYQRPDGTVIRFDDNAAVIIGPDKNPIGTRIIGPIAREIKLAGFSKIASLAAEVV